MSQTNNVANNQPAFNLQNPFSPTGGGGGVINNNNSTNNWAQTNSWHSANPLVMNHQLPAPSTTTASTLQTFNFDDLDPFGTGNMKSKQQQQQLATTQANTFTLQKPTVDYIYPVGYNQVKTNVNTPLILSGGGGGNNSMNMNSMMNANSSMAPLMPQSTTNAQQSHDSNNFNTLSQQDILSFLN